MRPAKLYLEIFVSFVLAIIISETMIFFLFTDSERRIVGYKMEQNTLIKVQMLKKLVDAHLSAPENINTGEEDKLKETLTSVAPIYDALIWIEDAGGNPLLLPAGGNIPEDLHLLETSSRSNLPDGIKLYNNIDKSKQVYASIPLEPRTGEHLTLYIVYNIDVPPNHKWQFLLGLLIIGTVVALLIIPVSKFITDRVKALKISALRIAEGELSHRVAVKAHDEIGELAIAFNQMAERLERMIVGGKELTANISHELRTPLTRIRISQEILAERLEKNDTGRCERYLTEIRENIEELDDLIGRILELSKLDLHEEKPNYEQFSPARLLEELTEKLAPVIAHKELTVRKNLPEIPPVTGDKAALTMALSNVLDNAAKFCPEKGVIHLGTTLNGDSYCIHIANTYEKLPLADLEKIFEPFYRSRKSNASGTGLGLSIAAKVVKKHGGTIGAFNSGDGFEIRLELPTGVGRSKTHRAEGIG